MKTESKQQSKKSTVDQMRAIRDQLSLEIQDLSPEQLKDYLNKKETLHPAMWQSERS